MVVIFFLIVRINLSKHKHELFSELYSSKKHHDVIFRIDDESIPAHRYGYIIHTCIK